MTIKNTKCPNSATFTVSKRRYYNAIVALLGGKSGAMTP